MVSGRTTRKKDFRCAHYTTSEEITEFMHSRLQAGTQDTIWDPCAGVGHLVKPLLNQFPTAKVTCTEIDPDAATELRANIGQFPNVHIMQKDALESDDLFTSSNPERFSRIIANPPYGAYQDPTRRAYLKSQFPELYVKETFGVFLYYALQRLQKGGRLVFILPDTLLSLHRHEPLRRHILSTCTLEEVCLFPSRFFPNINFGYSGLCIITLVKEKHSSRLNTRIISGLSSVAQLAYLATGQNSGLQVDYISQEILKSNSQSEILASPINMLSTSKLSDFASIVTGFYSGNDKRWLHRATDTVRCASRYERVIESKIAPLELRRPSLNGLDGDKTFIPIVRGGASPYIKANSWYVDWSRAAVAEYRKPGRNPARFQNSRFYFSEGIAVPMVASKNLTAALLQNRLFDQGIVGVFPHDQSLLYILLAFLNSKPALEMLRRINPTANNSANYLKRLPFVIPQTELRLQIEKMVEDIIYRVQAGRSIQVEQQYVDDLFRRVLASAEQKD